jgi:hypothetical protein
VPGSTPSAVSGIPSSLLKDPWVATVGADDASTAASRSLVEVLPCEPVTASTVRSPALRTVATTCAESRPRASWGSSTTTVGSAVAREPSTATAPLAAACGVCSCPSVCSPTKATNRLPGPAARPSPTTRPPTISATTSSVSGITPQP